MGKYQIPEGTLCRGASYFYLFSSNIEVFHTFLYSESRFYFHCCRYTVNKVHFFIISELFGLVLIDTIFFFKNRKLTLSGYNFLSTDVSAYYSISSNGTCVDIYTLPVSSPEMRCPPLSHPWGKIEIYMFGNAFLCFAAFKCRLPNLVFCCQLVTSI